MKTTKSRQSKTRVSRQIEFKKGNTHNPTLLTSRIICSRKRPCYRDKKCLNCLQRKRHSFIQQVNFFGQEWMLCKHWTVTLKIPKTEPMFCLAESSRLREKLFRRLFKNGKGKYVSVMAIGFNSKNKPTPHFHVLTSDDLTKKKIASAFVGLMKTHHKSICLREIHDLEGLAGYLFDQNYVRRKFF